MSSFVRASPCSAAAAGQSASTELAHSCCMRALKPSLGGMAVIVAPGCGKERPVSQLLICELCAKGYHMKCLQPHLTTLPEGLWICQSCADAGGTLAEAQRKQAQRQEALDRATLPNLYPDAAMKRRDQQAQQLHGRLIHKSRAEPGKSGRRWFWGRLHYRGPLCRPN
eukprot:gene3122-biopygen4775